MNISPKITFFCSFLTTIRIGAALLLLLGFSQCHSGDDDQPVTPDVHNIPVKAVINRFDRDLFAMDTAHFTTAYMAMLEKYPAMLPFFAKEVARDQTLPSQTDEEALLGFITAPQVRRLKDSCDAAFPSLDRFQKDLTELLRYYKYYFPKQAEPVTHTAVTEFVGDAYMINDTSMMVGLDFFLGKNFSGYDPDIFPLYLRDQFVPENMKVKYAFVLANYVTEPVQKDIILDNMIRNGKVLYIMDCLLPDVPDTLKINYTAQQWAESKANEQGVWKRLLDMKVLYEPVNPRNMKIVTAGPSTDNVFQEAPGQIGNWLGWQIVKAYIKRYPATSLEELAGAVDGQAFLEKAKYKPGKK